MILFRLVFYCKKNYWFVTFCFFLRLSVDYVFFLMVLLLGDDGSSSVVLGCGVGAYGGVYWYVCV